MKNTRLLTRAAVAVTAIVALMALQLTPARPLCQARVRQLPLLDH
jgi:hypothetical protein